MGNQDQGVFKDPLAPKENLVLGVYLVPLVVEDYLDQEERRGSLERKATRDHRVFQGLQAQGDQLDLPGFQVKKVKQACLVNLAILVRESQDFLVTVVLKVTLA